MSTIKIENLSAVPSVAHSLEDQHSKDLTREQMKAICGGVALSNGETPTFMVFRPPFEGSPEMSVWVPPSVPAMLPKSPFYEFFQLQ